jgi:hypothetical protein
LRKRNFPASITIVISSIILCVAIFTHCVNSGNRENTVIANAKGKRYAGYETCRHCHRAIYDSFLTSKHHLGSAIAGKKNILGSFVPGQNKFTYDSSHYVIMEERKDGWYQVAYENGKEVKSELFDITIGSGKRGQTYLFWNGGQLYQLPISWFAHSQSWANSPGFPTDRVSFDINIRARCLECHTTFAKGLLFSMYEPKQILYGIDCERCHGPAADHVEFHSEHPGEKKAKFIVNPAILSRQLNLDVCALCHSGVMESRYPAFSYFPGDSLSKYFVRNPLHTDSSRLDVHANQYGLLTASKCFRISGTMTCITCHNTHVKENGNLQNYNQKCMTCHTESDHNFCTLKPAAGFSLQENCTNCHMPVKESKNIALLTPGHSTPSPETVRSHLIAVYPDEIRKWMTAK